MREEENDGHGCTGEEKKGGLNGDDSTTLGSEVRETKGPSGMNKRE